MRNAVILLWMAVAAPLGFGAQSIFDPSQNVWTLGNGWIQAVFELSPDGYFLTRQISDLRSGDQWTPSPNRPISPVRLQAGTDVFDAQRPFLLLDQYTQQVKPSGLRQYIVLQDLNNAARITVILEVYDNQPVLRYSLRYRNLTGSQVYIRWIDMLPWSFDDAGQPYTAFRVNQWSVDSSSKDFEPLQTDLEPGGAPVEVYSGSGGQQCGWLALHDPSLRGLFAGWEFDGRVKTAVLQSGAPGYVQFSSAVLDLNHPVPPVGDFQTPYAFLGLFHGDWDEAGYRTQRFSEAVLAMPAPDARTFPYVSWDSWAYGDQIDQQTLRRNAEIAASVGVELFVVDLGWARAIGDWYEDPAKFPDGLSSVSDYVHSLGMKFGLHFALAEADPASPVLQANPDWTSTESDDYFGASSLCLSNQPARDWLVQQGIRIIDQYNVDWILQDGQNLVKQCTKTTHTHDPLDSNYSNAVDGLNAVVLAIQAARPNVYWENCENGGNMMTFNMVKSYVTSITNDASGSLSSRRAVYGATYPFSPRFAERYMPGSDGLDWYATGSYMFGGNWVLMNRLPDLTSDQVAFLSQQIGVYKSQRADIAAGKGYHILPPAADGTDAIQSYNPATDTAFAVITRAQDDGSTYIFRPLGLDPDQRYAVWFANDPSNYWITGSQLMLNGVRVQLPTPYSSDIVHIQHQ
jgi:alpha-galactosidase